MVRTTKADNKPYRNAFIIRAPTIIICRMLPWMNYFFLCRFFLSFFLRLCVAILCRFRFLPQGTDSAPLSLPVYPVSTIALKARNSSSRLEPQAALMGPGKYIDVHPPGQPSNDEPGCFNYAGRRTVSQEPCRSGRCVDMNSSISESSRPVPSGSSHRTSGRDLKKVICRLA